MGVALQAALGVTVGLLVAGEVPDNQGLVAAAGEEHVGAIDRKETKVRKPIVLQNHDNSTNRRQLTLDRYFYSYPLLLERGSQASNPAIVTLEGTAKNQLLSHDGSLGLETMKGAAEGERRRRRMNAGGAMSLTLGLG